MSRLDTKFRVLGDEEKMASLSIQRVRILLIEDEIDLAEPLAEGLREDGFEVRHCATGEAARRVLEEHWDIVVLDLMLPDMSGESLIHYLRQRVDYPNVLVLSAKSGLQDRLQLFRLGCDDYLTKPYIYDELVERVHALLRRSRRISREDFCYRSLQLDFEKGRLSDGASAVCLTPKEAAICRMLLTRPGRVVSRREILHGVWGLKEESDSNFIGVHIFNLRKKFAQLGYEQWFRTVRSSGFMIASPDSVAHEN